MASEVAGGQADVLVFETEGDLIAVAALEVDPEVPSIWDLHVVAIANEHQGSRTRTQTGELPLVKVVLDTAMKYAADRGAEAVRAIVATRNARSIQMLLLQGFTRGDRFDKDYDEYIATIHSTK